jgi:hypothetical protein
MGQLTNQFVSQSYQGLLNLANANTGFTTNLQTITDGLGGSSPLQISKTQVNISGSFTVNGQPVSVDTGSLVTTSSFNAYTSSVDLRFDGIELETGSLQNQINGLASTGSLTSLSSSIAVTDLAQNGRLTSLEGITGSLQNQINQKLDTGSFNTYTSSVNSKLAGLDIETGSLQNQINGLATTSSLTSLSSSIATTDLNQNNVIAGLATTSSLTSLSSSIAVTDLSQNNRLTSLEGVTGSINRNGLITTGSIGGTQSITGSLNVSGQITALSASITYLETIFQTSSVLFSSGSNILGDEASDTQTLFGTVRLPNGPLVVTGSVRATNFTGSLQGTASFATNALSSSFATIASNSLNLGGLAATSYARRNSSNIFTSDNTFQDNVTIESGSQLFAYEIHTEPNERLLILSDGTPSGPGARIIFGDTPSGGGGPIQDTTVSITGSLGVSGVVQAPTFAGTATNASQLSNRGIAQFALTGSNSFNGNQNVTGAVTASAGFLGNLTGTASFATNALSASWAPDTTNTGSFMITGSVSGPTSTFTKGDGSTFNLTVDNVQSASFADNAGTASFVNSAVTASIAFDLVVNGKCDNPGGLTKGTIVRITGANGDNPLFNSASWTDDFNSANTLGMLSENVAYNGFANVVVQGKVIGINTDNMTAGDLLFLSSSGQYTTSSVPAPYHEVRLGQVLRPQLNNGSAYISIDNGYELSELHDVDITSPVNGDLLVYRSGSYGQWVNETGGELGFATTGSNTFVGNQTILGALEINSPNPIGTFVNIISTGTTSFLLNSPLTQFQSNGEMLFKNTISSTGSSDINFRTENGGDITFNTFNSGSVAITSSLNVTGSQHRIIGNTLITGSLSVTDNQTNSRDIRMFSSASYANPLMQPGQFITSSTLNSSNIIFAPNVATTGQGFIDGSVTGSIIISGSNNILLTSNRGNSPVGLVGHLNNNNIANTIPTLNTSSVYKPNVSNNLIYGGLVMTMGSGSGAWTISNNSIYGLLNLNIPSASLGGTYSSNILAGQLTVQQTVPVTGSQVHNFQQNVINGTVGIQINSGSLQFANNSINGVAQITGSYLSTGATASNFVLFNGNTINGNNHRFLFGGVGNGTRTFRDNLIGGALFTGSIVANNNEGIQNFMAFGRGLYAEGGLPGGADTAGSTFLGRWNETGSLSNPGQYRFVIGNGTDAANRRTSLALDGPLNTFVFNSNINQSGSFRIAGLTNTFVVTGSATIQHSIAGQPALTLIAQSIGQPALTISGSLNVSGSGDHTIRGNSLSITTVGPTTISSSMSTALNVSGTINSQRLHFDVNPFNSNPSSNLGAIRMAGDNQTFQYTNYDIAEITTQSFIDQLVNTGSLTTQTRLGARYAGTEVKIDAINNNGTRRVDILSDSMTVTGSMNISSVMNMRPLNPLPAGNIGDLAVSSSNQLYFYNGAWTLVV